MGLFPRLRQLWLQRKSYSAWNEKLKYWETAVGIWIMVDATLSVRTAVKDIMNEKKEEEEKKNKRDEIARLTLEKDVKNIELQETMVALAKKLLDAKPMKKKDQET